MATGLARGARAKGKRIAFGDGKRIIWDKHSHHVFQGNPNIAMPGAEREAADIEWVPFYKGHRIYNRQEHPDRWTWNLDFHATPGQMFFRNKETDAAKRYGDGFILIEPNVPAWKSSAPNKDWGRAKYQKVAEKLRAGGHRVAQFVTGEMRGAPLSGVDIFRPTSFRDALAILAHAALYVGPEGGLHHGAAAVGIPGVVIFGGFIPPSVTGYATHTNLTGRTTEACGSLKPCSHCRRALNSISVEEVHEAARKRL